ncbi:MAG TPA: sulfite exporter TauE/SafE family protein [Flavobacteriales bacterium]|nr:sulfite exporter TauE/SafE family protein [Flavobacteriales bacterium]
MNDWLIPLAILIIAFLYSSVGHGGASGYLALLAILQFAPDVMKPSALALNIIVSSIAFVPFARAGLFRFNLFWPFAITSVPMSFVGAGVHLDPATYGKVLGACLLVAVARLFGVFGQWRGEVRPINTPLAMAIGASIGFVAGAIGIGGGILLSPVLLLLRWCTAKEGAAISALFILVNSASGITRYWGKTDWITDDIPWWIMAAVIGGVLGSNIGAKRFTDIRLKQVLGATLLFASLKLFLV